MASVPRPSAQSPQRDIEANPTNSREVVLHLDQAQRIPGHAFGASTAPLQPTRPPGPTWRHPTQTHPAVCRQAELRRRPLRHRGSAPEMWWGGLVSDDKTRRLFSQIDVEHASL